MKGVINREQKNSAVQNIKIVVLFRMKTHAKNTAVKFGKLFLSNAAFFVIFILGIVSGKWKLS